MANKEHLAILKQGEEAWKQWRIENRIIVPDLRRADLSGAYLRLAFLSKADLSEANLSEANLNGASLNGADLRQANLSGANLTVANLSGADLRQANLQGADLFGANLTEADLNRADLREADLHYVHLSGANVEGAIADWTVFGDVDLSEVKGLEAVLHVGPSTIGIDTIYKSKGRIPEVFLRGCGVPDNFIAYMGSLVGKPIEYYSCFISYSSRNQDFAERLHADLQDKGVRCWFAPEDIKIGEKFRTRIDAAIRLHDKLLLILSKNSIQSSWVESEVEAALERERRQKRVVLFPVRLDDTIMRTRKAWAADIRRTRHIGDFCCWKDHDAYQKAFDRLLRDLKAESAEA